MKPARLALLAATVVIGVLVVLALRDRGGHGRTPSYAELVAKNYRVLTPSQSQQLVRFADKEYRCLVAHGAGVSRPVPSPTRITMSAPGLSARGLVRLLGACDRVVGPPPVKATLQARPGQVLIYLPKWCLIDPKQLPPAASAPLTRSTAPRMMRADDARRPRAGR
jgi:hypothetical protein